MIQSSSVTLSHVLPFRDVSAASGGRRATAPLDPSTGRPHDDVQRLRLRRAGAVAALAGVAFLIGTIVGAARSGSSASALARGFVAAWTRGDYAAMYADIDAGAQREVPVAEFEHVYAGALRTATATRATLRGHPRGEVGGLVAVPVRVHTRLFGNLALDFHVKVENGGEGDRVAWTPALSFPGLYPGERLVRQTNLPRRAALLARDGTVLAESLPPTTGAPVEATERPSPLGPAASAVVGEVGPVPAARRARLAAQGVPPSATVGVSGLELALDEQLRGSPGGELLARAGPGRERVLAAATPHPAAAVRTTVSAPIQRAAVAALGGQLGGVVAIAPATGQLLAVAGLGLDSVQPPGSTFKMVTVTGVLAAGIADPRTTFPYATHATLDGARLDNANGEECGGSLELAFAVSCNSVFAPLGVKLGAARLVATAEAYGFNQPPPVTGAATSTIPPASQIQGELDVGSTAIGQGRVLASALQMALVAATIGDSGSRPQPTFTPGPPAPRVPVASAAVARTVRHLMIAVVREGTGTSAAIPGVTVAGKTGTAELKTTTGCSPAGESGSGSAGEPGQQGCGAASEASSTDAWFAAFAPAIHPRIAVGVLMVKDGAGGATAAPVAREVLEAGLKASR
jgi:penicillin-binding protein A